MDASYWDSVADTVARERSEILSGEQSVCWETALSTLLSAKKALRILDAGCGSGFLSVILKRLGHNVTGIDISPVMIQCAYETASSFGQRIEYRIMDCGDMDFGDESFDAIVCCEALSYMQDAKHVLTEFRRVLKKGGYIIIFDTGDISANLLGTHGFTHCRVKCFDGLAEYQVISARKPSKAEKAIIPQITLFDKHIQTAKKQIQLYQNWSQSMGMPYSEYMVLSMIARHSKGVRPSDISATLVMPPQTLTRILAGLEKSGYTERKTNERDHRSAVITITDAGAEKIKPLQAMLRDIGENALSGFDADELAALNGLSERLLNSLESVFGDFANRRKSST